METNRIDIAENIFRMVKNLSADVKLEIISKIIDSLKETNCLRSIISNLCPAIKKNFFRARVNNIMESGTMISETEGTSLYQSGTMIPEKGGTMISVISKMKSKYPIKVNSRL